MLRFSEEPQDWIVKHGRPSRACQFPAYESETGKILVFECLIAALGEALRPMLLPMSYGKVVAGSPDGLCHLHLAERDREVALLDQQLDQHERLLQFKEPPPKRWRPKVYRQASHGMEIMGSQQELGWRRDYAEVQRLRLIEDVSEEEVIERMISRQQAMDRAIEILWEHCSPQQRLELLKDDTFRVRGRLNLYRIRLDNGFCILDPFTNEEIVSYCLHPEYFMPSADVALAIKLALEDEELEVRCLENARIGDIYRPRAKTPSDLKAYELEKKLIDGYPKDLHKEKS